MGQSLLGPRGLAREIGDAQILSSISPMGHPVGTCAMGQASNPMAVGDGSCRVHGMENLFVVDASVMPVIPSANTTTTRSRAGIASRRGVDRRKARNRRAAPR